VLGLGFARVLDRDRSLLARLEIKSDRGTNAIEIRPPLGEMLRPCRVGSDDFKGLFERMHGIHQRTTASISLTPAAGTTMREYWNVLPLQIQKHANLTPVGQSGWKENTCRFGGRLPANGGIILISISCSPKTGSGDIIVCCDDIMAANSLLDLLKRAVTYDGSI